MIHNLISIQAPWISDEYFRSLLAKQTPEKQFWKWLHSRLHGNYWALTTGGSWWSSASSCILTDHLWITSFRIMLKTRKFTVIVLVINSPHMHRLSLSNCFTWLLYSNVFRSWLITVWESNFHTANVHNSFFLQMRWILFCGKYDMRYPFWLMKHITFIFTILE